MGRCMGLKGGKKRRRKEGGAKGLVATWKWSGCADVTSTWQVFIAHFFAMQKQKLQ